MVGLSATLPNYTDIADFIGVERKKEALLSGDAKKQKSSKKKEEEEIIHPKYDGLFHFPNNFRPVPLSQTFIGIKERKGTKKDNLMNTLVYDKITQCAFV